MRIYKEIPSAKLASFSTLKYVSSQNFFKFKKYFKAEFINGFIVPAHTFDNVNGKFPIGFLIWNTENMQNIKEVTCDVFKKDYIGQKTFYSFEQNVFIINWLRLFYDKKSERIAYLRMQGTDMQNNQGVFFTNNPTKNDLLKKLTTNITKNNVVEMSIYLAVRHVFEATWLNDRDQFLYPNDGWQEDTEFQNDCLAFSLFHSQNKITSLEGTNHWIPFTAYEVNAQAKFESTFMTDFIKGKIKKEVANETLFEQAQAATQKPLVFSEEATAVFDAGRALWHYYHAQQFPSFGGVAEGRGGYNVNASLYDIRAHFQGRNDKGRMNSKSDDATYMQLIGALRESLKTLAEKIKPKVYDYGFLKP